MNYLGDQLLFEKFGEHMSISSFFKNELFILFYWMLRGSPVGCYWHNSKTIKDYIRKNSSYLLSASATSLAYSPQ